MAKKRLKKSSKFRRRLFFLITILFLVLGSAKGVAFLKNLLGFGEYAFKAVGEVSFSKRAQEANYFAFKDALVVYDGERLTLNAWDGRQIWEVGLEVKHPLVVASQDRVYIADADSGEILGFDGSGMKRFEKKLSKPLFDLSCSSRGDLAVATEKTRGADVYLYNGSGKETGKIEIPKGYLLDVEVSEKAPELVGVSVMSTENYALQSDVALYTLEGRITDARMYKGEVFSNLLIRDGREVFATGEAGVLQFDTAEDNSWEKKVESPVISVAVSDAGEASLCLKREGGAFDSAKSSLLLLDAKGSKKKLLDFKDSLKGLVASKDMVVAFSDRTVYFVSKGGEKVREKPLSSDIRSVKLVGEDLLAIEGKHKIYMVRFKLENDAKKKEEVS